MGRIEDKILGILNEGIEYEIVGGPSPSETLKAPLDYAKNVKKATVPQATNIPGVGEIGSDDADKNDPITDVVDALDEDEDDDKKGDDDDDDDKDDITETFAQLLARLAEEDDKDDDDDDDDKDLDEDETSLKGSNDNGGKPEEVLPDVESDLRNPDKLVNKAPGIKVAEDETSLKGDNGGEPEETLPGASIDSLMRSPEKLVTPAPGAKAPDTVVEDEDDEDTDDDKEDADKKDVSEDIEAIFSGIKLSESAKTKAATIFKAALTSRVNEEKTRVQRVATKKLKEAFAVLKDRYESKQNVFESKLTTQVDRYLNYVVENWMTENRLAVERGIRAELAEDFIRGLKNLFVEHYIEVPESKVDVVATLGKKVTKLESKLNESVESNVKLRSTVNAYRKEEVVRAVSSGLPETQRERLAKLAEGVDFTTRKDFSEKLVSLRESYFPKKAASVKKEEPLVEQVAPKTANEMSLYTKTLSKFKKD